MNLSRPLSALLLLALSGCVGATGQQVVDASSDVALTIRNPDGPVSLSAGAADAVVVSWTLHSAEGAAEADDVEVTVAGEGSSVSVNVAVASSEFWADLDIAAPAGASWNIESGEGDVTLDGMTAGGAVVTTTGFVTGAGLAGSLDVSSSLSEISIETTVEAGDDVAVALGEGPISLFVPAETDALLTASTDSGSVLIEGVPFSGTNVGGQATGELGAGATATVTLQTGAGDIRIAGPQ